MKIACGVEAACGSPRDARRFVAVRQCCNRRQSQKKRVCDRALLGGDSLPEREWNHANSHKQKQKQKQVKGASKKMRFNGGVKLFFHFTFSFFKSEILDCMRDHGRGGGVGRALGVGAILGVGAAAQYLPVLIRVMPSAPPQTIISLPLHTAV